MRGICPLMSDAENEIRCLGDECEWYSKGYVGPSECRITKILRKM